MKGQKTTKIVSAVIYLTNIHRPKSLAELK